MISSPLETVLARLEGVKKTATGYMAKCPAHEDRTPSLSIREGDDGRVLIHDFAGCDLNRILRAVDLTSHDLFYPQANRPDQGTHTAGATRSRDQRSHQVDAQERSSPAPKVVGERRWTVATIDGEAVDHVRHDYDDGTKRMWFERGGKPGLKGLAVADLPLYGIDDVADARAVIVAEGEHSRDVLHPIAQKLDYAVVGTVTGAGGAKRPSDAVLATLPDVPIFFWPDSDGPGEEHMTAMATALRTARRRGDHLRRITWPGARVGAGDDAADFVTSLDGIEGQVQELQKLIRASTPFFLDGPQTAPGPCIINAADLASKTFAEPRYAVDGIIPDGASLFVGAPKKGKSWLLLNLGVAIAAGGYALGKVKVEQGEVLLLCLEDNQRRLQERLWRVLDGEPAPSGLHLVTEWPRLNDGAEAALDEWLTKHPQTRLVGVDVLARLRPTMSNSGNLYQLDYSTLSQLKAVADRHGVALVVVHHSRKASAEDPFDTISGTAGLGGAADTAIILTREKGRADGNLYVRGRDVPEADYALSFDPVTCRWSLLGDAAEFKLSEPRAAVLELLRKSGPLDPKTIAERLKADRGNIRVLLHRMRNAGDVLASDGIYSAPVDLGVTGVTPPKTPATTRKMAVTPPVTPPEHVTPPVTGKTHATTRNFDPVTGVTAENRIQDEPAYRNGHREKVIDAEFVEMVI